MAAIGERNEYDHEVHRANSSEYNPKNDYNQKGGEYYNESDVEYNKEHVEHEEEEEENSPIEEVAAVVPA